MKKKKIDVSSDNSVIASWVKTNEDKLSEVQQVNPDLFTAMQSALNYLNNYLGGTEQITIEPKTVTTSIEELTQTVIGETKPYPIPFYQWRLLSNEELSVQGIELFNESDEGQPLVTLTNDVVGINKIAKYRQSRVQWYFDDLGETIRSEEITLFPKLSKEPTRPNSIQFILEAEIYCRDKDFNELFNYAGILFKEYKIFLRKTNEFGDTLNVSELETLYARSIVGFWFYYYGNVILYQQDFLEYELTTGNGHVVKIQSVSFNTNIQEFEWTLLDWQGNQTAWRTDRLEATKAYLGLSFNSYSDDGEEEGSIFQAVKLKNFQPLPFIIGDTVAVIENGSMSAELGATAEVKGVLLWEWKNNPMTDVPSGVQTHLDVKWLDDKQNKQSDGGYSIEKFKNLSRPQKKATTTVASTAKVWRVKTEAEFEAEYGSDWRTRVAWSPSNQKDILFGKKLQDILDADSLRKMPTTKNLPDYEYLNTTDEFRGYGLNNEDITDAPLPTANTSTTEPPTKSITIQDVLNRQNDWSSGLILSMQKDFIDSGYENVDNLIGADMLQTSQNIQAKVNGFSSGKNTYLQANMLAKNIHAIMSEDKGETSSESTTQTNKPFDIKRKEAYKFSASTPEEAWAFQQYLFFNGLWRDRVYGSQNIDPTATDFLVENGLLYVVSPNLFSSLTAEQVSLSTLGIKVEDYPRPAPVKKTPKKSSTPKVEPTLAPKPDVSNLYNELDDLDI